MNIHDKLQNRTTVLQQYSQFHGKFHHLELQGEAGNRMYFNNKEMIVWCLNDYLGLMNYRPGIEAAAAVTASYGASYPHSVRMSIGHSAQHDELERMLADHMQREEAMLLQLGYQGIFSIVDALTDRHDTIIYDQKVHACLIDGIRLHNGKKASFIHNNMKHLETQLRRATEQQDHSQGTIFVIVDGLYSMHGETAPLDQIAKLKEQFDFCLIVDDSHGFGVFGDNGRGTPEFYNVEDQVDIYISTFTKSLGSLGAFVSASKQIITYLRFATRSQIFSRTMALPQVVTVIENLKAMQRQPERRERLWDNVNTFHNGLREMGINIGKSEGPITPIHITGSIEEGMEILLALREEFGVFSYMVAYPVVEKGHCLIRMVVTANHTEEDVAHTLESIRILKARYSKQLSRPISLVKSQGTLAIRKSA